MRKLKTFVAVLMLVFVLGLSAPQALAGDVYTPGYTEPGEMQSPPGDTLTPPAPGEINSPGLTGEIPIGGFATWAKIFFQMFG